MMFAMQFPPPAPPVQVFQSGPPAAAIVLIALTGIIAVTLILYPLVRAWARRLEGGMQQAPDTELQSRVEHLEQRLAEAEERLDFAERMLSRPGDAIALPRQKAD
ncbi:MAG: hypothetical protein ACHQXA_02980 [Gemmatimonadales bacterium]